MFGRGLHSGFDTVIGNPPWGAKLSKDEKSYLKLEYPEVDSSTPNSFAYFSGVALQLSNKAIAFVYPDSILLKDFAKLRKNLAPSLTRVDWYMNTGIPERVRPFVYVEHDVCVLIQDVSTGTDTCKVSRHVYNRNACDLTTETLSQAKSEFIIPRFNRVINLKINRANAKILKIVEGHPELGDITQCHEGIHTGNSRNILFHKGKINNYCKPLFYGGRAGDVIDNYVSRTSGWYVDYRKKLIDKRKGYYASLRDERIFLLPKIYVTRTGNPLKAFYDDGNYASNNFFSIQIKDYSENTEQRLKSLLPLLLSTFANYFIRTFAAPRLGNTYVETKIIHLNKIPVSESLQMNGKLFKVLTDCIITSILNLNCKPNIRSFFEDLIDACVMECYFREHMAERDLLFHHTLGQHIDSYNPNANPAWQKHFIEQFYRRLNSPDSVIRNRLLRLTADSPDLLAVIKKEDRA